MALLNTPTAKKKTTLHLSDIEDSIEDIMKWVIAKKIRDKNLPLKEREEWKALISY